VNAPWLEGEIVARLATDFGDREYLSRTIGELGAWPRASKPILSRLMPISGARKGG
jgi:hypothetical protein